MSAALGQYSQETSTNPSPQFRSNWLVDPSNGTYTATIRSPTGGPADPALTAHGVDQARELGERLLVADPPVERVYSSLYYRCLQTVEPFVRKAPATAASRGPFTVRGETGLGEWYGAADFEHPVPASLETLKPLFPGLLDLSYQPVVSPSRRGEGIHELHDRVAATMRALIDECDRDGVRAVLLCSHAATIIALGRVLTGYMPENIEAEDFCAFTCGLSVYRRRRKETETSVDRSVGEGARLEWRDGRGVAGGWDCELNSDCSHLSQGEERGWRFSGDESFPSAASESSLLDAGVELGVVVAGRGKTLDGAASRGKL